MAIWCGFEFVFDFCGEFLGAEVCVCEERGEECDSEEQERERHVDCLMNDDGGNCMGVYLFVFLILVLEVSIFSEKK